MAACRGTWIVVLALAACLLAAPARAEEWLGGMQQAQALLDAGQPARALELARRALAQAEAAHGPGSLPAALGLNILGVIHRSLGEFPEAEEAMAQSLAAMEAHLGPDAPAVGVAVNNLALIRKDQGRYAEAEPLYRRALAIHEKAEGPEGRNVAIALDNLATLLAVLGDWDEAEALHRRAGAMFVALAGEDSPEVARNRNNLAELYSARKEYDKALPLSRRALDIWRDTLGPDHPDTITAMSNLGTLHFYKGDLARAEPLLRDALAGKERLLGPTHLDVAMALNNLASLLRAQWKIDEALATQRRALAIWESRLGTHPMVSTARNNLATLLILRNDPAGAFAAASQAQDLDEALVRQMMGVSSEARRLAFLDTARHALHAIMTLHLGWLREDAAATRRVFELWLRRKGIVLDTQRRFQAALLAHGDATALARFQELATLREEASRLAMSTPGEGQAEGRVRKLAALARRQRELEDEIARRSEPFARGKRRAAVDLEAVAAALPAGAVLLEYVRLDLFDFEDVRGEVRWKPARHAVFVLRAGEPASLRCLDLGPAAPVEEAVAALAGGLARGRDDDATRKAARDLDAAVLAPLLPWLGGATDLFVSPDGALALVPFEVFLDENGRRRIEEYTFTYLHSGRDLVGMGETPSATGPALVVGDPDYDLRGEGGALREGETAGAGSLSTGAGTVSRAFTAAGAEHGTGETVTSETVTRAARLGELHFARLPGAADEARAVAPLLGDDTVTLLADAALERALRERLRSATPRVLHLATHGFFLPPPPEVAGRAGEGAVPENPLARSGLALAGANPAVRGEGLEGILTAEKVLSLPLLGTELVVLSACETGRGDPRDGEGVFGLRRAFGQAGAKGLVMSLWPVPDAETAELMTTFHEGRREGLDSARALRRAALRQRELLLRATGQDNPAAWGGFIFAGER